MNLLIGIHENVSDADYQRDPCSEISLRSSTAWKLVEKGGTPAAAAFECPRLNHEYVREEKRHFDIGNAAHALLFEKGKVIEPILGYDYAKNEKDGLTKTEKQAARDGAYDAGRIPLLIPEQKQVIAMVKSARSQIDALVASGTIEANPFGPRQSEQVLVARINGVLCRCMMDGFSIEGDTLSEYKTEGQSAAQENWMWKARKMGYVFRLAFYRKCLEALKIAYSPHVHIFVQETFPPYLLAFYRVEDEFIAREDENVERALKIWKRCLERNRWPGYPTGGFDLGLTEKEQMKDAVAVPRNEHLLSEDMPADAYSPVRFGK